MNKKIKNYIDILFEDIPQSKKAKELKEELLSNMNERFDDYVNKGESENQAYSLAISSLGDIDEMLNQLMPDENFKYEANKYRKRNATTTALAISMYILGGAILIGMGAYGEFIGSTEALGAMGFVFMLVFSAIATGLLVYTNMSTPLEYKGYETKKTVQYQEKQNSTYENLIQIYWLIVTFIYFVISFFTNAWNVTWIIWVLAVIFAKIIKLIIELRGIDE